MQNPEAEIGVLAGIMEYGSDSYIDVSDLINTDSFCDSDRQIFFSCFKHIFDNDINSTIDYQVVYNAAKSLGCSDIVERERLTLRSIRNTRVAKPNVRKLAGVLAKCKIIRDLMGQVGLSQSNLLELTGNEPIDSIISAAESPIFDFTSKLNSEDDENNALMGDGMIEYIEHLGANPRDMIGISTGMPIYDQAIGGGLQRGDANFICARPKKGKSTIADNVSMHISMNLGIPVLQLDSEMKKTRHQIRIASNISEIPMNDIKSGKYYENIVKKQKVLDAANSMKTAPFYYKNISGMDYQDVLSYIRRWIVRKVGFDENGKTKDSVIIYDYFKLCSSDGLSKNLGEHQLLGFQLMDMINLIIKYDVALLAFAQQNRGGIDEDTSDTIAGSDRILMYCGSLSLFQAKTPDEIAEDGIQNGNRKLKVIDARDGEQITDSNWINMQLSGPINRIKELTLRSQQNINIPMQAAPDDANDTDIF